MKGTRTVANILLICLVLIILTLVTFAVVVALYIPKNKLNNKKVNSPFDIELCWDSGSTFLKEYVQQVDLAEFVTIAKSDKEIIAPNTSGSMTLRVKGNSVEPFALALNIEEIYSNNWKTAPDGETYHPIVLRVVTNLRGEEMSAEIQPGLFVDLGVFEPNINFDGLIKIIWEWPYHTSEFADKADTYMGSLGIEATYSLKVTATATQVNR